MLPNGQLHEYVKFVTGLPPIAPSSSTPDAVSLKNFDNLTVVILVDNGATVTGSAIALLQAQDVSNTGGKTLAFDTVYANVDTGAADTLTSTAVTSNTFTTNTTDNKNLMYVIEIAASDLDVDNNFDCVQVTTGNSVNAVVSVLYCLTSKYAGADLPAITD